MSEWHRLCKRPWYLMGEEFLFWNRTRVGHALQFGYNADAIEIDEYGNPIDGSSQPYCCFPNCGCPEARLCMAENGPNYGADVFLNLGQ